MKKIIFILISSIFLSFFYNNINEYKKIIQNKKIIPHFCIKVAQYPSYEAYEIKFRNYDNMPFESIMDAFDISCESIPDGLCYQPLIFDPDFNGGLPAAINFAKQFDTYSKCIVFNVRAAQHYKDLMLFRKNHAIIQPKNIPAKPITKEVIIKCN